MNNLFLWLLNWYHSQCNGLWEHNYGIRIETTNKPGWIVIISIQETSLQFKPFKQEKIKKSEIDWIDCAVKDGFFIGHCSVNNLSEIFQKFQEWAEDVIIDKPSLDENMKWLLNWFQKKCNGVWEHRYGIRFSTIDNPGWILNINLQDTPYRTKLFEKIKIERSNDDWIHIAKQNETFACVCGPFNLPEILQIFHNWIESKNSTSSVDKIQWETVKRFDSDIHFHSHFNKYFEQWIDTPHIHDPHYPGGVRYPEPWEIPYGK